MRNWAKQYLVETLIKKSSLFSKKKTKEKGTFKKATLYMELFHSFSVPGALVGYKYPLFESHQTVKSKFSFTYLALLPWQVAL